MFPCRTWSAVKMSAATIAIVEIRFSQTARSRCISLDQAAFAEIAEITAARALHHVDGELEQANFPCVVHTLNHSAERFVCSLNPAFCAIDHCVDRITKRLLAQIGFAKLKTIPKDCDVPRVFP